MKKRIIGLIKDTFPFFIAFLIILIYWKVDFNNPDMSVYLLGIIIMIVLILSIISRKINSNDNSSDE
jgi:hypothetical protein